MFLRYYNWNKPIRTLAYMLFVEFSLDLILSFFIYHAVLTPMQQLSGRYVLYPCVDQLFEIVFQISFLRRIILSRRCLLIFVVLVTHFNNFI